MLGKLARWLLLLGYDTVYVSDGACEDMDAVAQAKEEGRVFVTRDTKIPEVAGVRKVVLRNQDLGGQLRRLLDELRERPDPGLFFSRCTLCNVPTKAVARDEVVGELPEKVKTLETRFFRCPSCSKLYWAGTHVENTMKKVRELLRT